MPNSCANNKNNSNNTKDNSSDIHDRNDDKNDNSATVAILRKIFQIVRTTCAF